MNPATTSARAPGGPAAPARPRRRRVLVVAVLTAVAVAVAVTAVLVRRTGQEERPAGSGLPWVSGASDDKGLASFERWRGRPADVRVMWNSADTWANATPVYGLREAAREGERRRVSYAVPLVTAEPGQTLALCAAGGNDERFRQMARGFVEHGFGDAVVRPGWEGSADWYPWGVTAPRNGGPERAVPLYRECFQRFAAVFREQAPDVRIELNYGAARGATNIADVYPGDGYVDIVSNDVYLSHEVRSAADWREQCWAGTPERPQGLCRYAQFARERGIEFAVPEWGVDGTNAPDADAAAYVAGMIALFRDNSDVLAYEAYYNRTNDPAQPCEFRLDEGCNPEAASTYLRLVGPGAEVAAG